MAKDSIFEIYEEDSNKKENCTMMPNVKVLRFSKVCHLSGLVIIIYNVPESLNKVLSTCSVIGQSSISFHYFKVIIVFNY